MASTGQILATSQGPKPNTNRLSPQPCPVDEPLPHRNLSTSQKSMPPACGRSTFKDSSHIRKWIMHIAVLKVMIIVLVFAVLSYRAASARNKKNDAAQRLMTTAQSNANALAALVYCSIDKVSSDSVHWFCMKCRPSLFFDLIIMLIICVKEPAGL